MSNITGTFCETFEHMQDKKLKGQCVLRKESCWARLVVVQDCGEQEGQGRELEELSNPV